MKSKMNKQELIEKIDNLQYTLSWNIPRINKETVLDLIEQLDEPQKPVVPQFVADWYENNKDYLEHNFQDWLKHLSEYRLSKNEQFGRWVNEPENNPAETLIKMKLFGYEVENEKRYLVKMEALKSDSQYLVFGQLSGKWWFDSDEQIGNVESKHTCKELEEAGFGWVFDCDGVEVQEVE